MMSAGRKRKLAANAVPIEDAAMKISLTKGISAPISSKFVETSEVANSRLTGRLRTAERLAAGSTRITTSTDRRA